MALPEAPTALAADPSYTAVVVSFTQVEADPPITNYAYELDGSTTWVPLDPPDATSPIVIKGLAEGTSHTLVIHAINDEGDGALSNQLFFDTLEIDDRQDGYNDPNPFANQGLTPKNLDYADPDD